MASACIVEVPSVPTFSLNFQVESRIVSKQTESQPLPTATEDALTDEELTVILLRWDTDIRRAARAAANRFELDESYADDFAQEARIRLVGAVRRQPSLPEEYLRRVISNAIQTAVSATRFSNTQDSLDDVANHFELESPNSLADADPLTAAAVANFIVGLPPSLQRIYELLYEQGQTQRQAATQLGVAQPRIAQLHRDLLSRAKRHLASYGAAWVSASPICGRRVVDVTLRTDSYTRRFRQS